MKKFNRFFWISLFFLFYSVSGYSQNLIADPGFEIWDGTSGGGGSTLSGLTHWYEANGTSDHHHVDIEGGNNLNGLEPCPLMEGNTWCGYPYEGGGVLGCWKGNGPDGSKEWGGTQLLEPLEPGECYEISFWIQNKKDDPHQLYETNQWGVFFSNTQYPTFNANLSDFNTMADHWVTSEEVISGSEWQQVRFSYTASEAFEYMYIGYVGNVSNSTFTAANDDYMLGFYVWIDEVIVQKVDVEVPEDLTICAGDSILLEFQSNYTVSWTNGTEADTTRSVWAIPENTTTYYVEAIGDMGCTKLDSVVLTVLPEERIDYPEPFCVASDPFVLDPTVGAGSWSGVGVVDPYEGLFDPSLAGSGAFEVSFVSTEHCSEDFILTVTVEETPDIEITADVTEGCAPLTVAFEDAGPTQGLAYEWSFSDGTGSTDPGFTDHTFTQPGSYDLTVAVTHFENCTSSFIWDNAVNVFEAPIANFEYSPENPDLLEREVNFEDTSEGNIFQWQWDFGEGTANTRYNPVHEYFEPGDYEVQLVVTGLGNCQDSISRIVSVRNKVRMYLPNAFSPNDDGINDRLEVGFAGMLYDYKMTVFNRWGGLIFESSDPSNGWDGKAPDGQLAERGVYTYFIEYSLSSENPSGNKQSEIVSGDVMIMR